MKPSRLLLPILAALALLSSLSGCARFDPRYATLAPYIETNPSPRAIVGMWHYRKPDFTLTHSLLFRADGTVLSKSKWRDLDAVLREDKYRYMGNGVWKVGFSDRPYQLARGYLVITNGYGEVYERQ